MTRLRACARGSPTCIPHSTRSDSARRLSVRSRPAMGSGPAAGSVRARYLVYFQYLGTDFKYVPQASLRAPRRPQGGTDLHLGFAPPASGPFTGEGMVVLAEKTGALAGRSPPSDLRPPMPTAASPPSGAPSAPSGSRTTWR